MKKILLVEDDPFILDIYAHQFKKEGYEVSVATDGQMALEIIKNNCPDLLILDIGLPKLDGWEVLKMLRDDLKTKKLRVIVISNNDQKESAENITRFGVLKYFLKIEHTTDEIVKHVREILK